jgi:hypothetical protein
MIVERISIVAATSLGVQTAIAETTKVDTGRIITPAKSGLRQVRTVRPPSEGRSCRNPRFARRIQSERCCCCTMCPRSNAGTTHRSLEMSRTPGTSLRRAVLGVVLATLFANGARLLAQTAPIPFVDSGAASSALPTLKSGVVDVEMLTDTQGEDFTPYIKEVIQRFSPSSRAIKAVPGSVSAPSTLLTVTIDRWQADRLTSR